MTQGKLFPDEGTNVPARAVSTDFARFLLEHAPDVKDPVEYEDRQREAFPDLDLLQEARRALAWNAAQPASIRKKAIGRFLNNWFARSYHQRRPAQSAVSISPGSDFQGGYRRVK
jgi:hypothetical protein